MSKPEKQSGSHLGKWLGWREKKLLLAMLKLDAPPILWWDILSKLRIFLIYGTPTKHWQKGYPEERKYKYALRRLLKRDLAKFVVGEVFLPPVQKTGPDSTYLTYALTEKGRKVAKELEKQKDREEDLKKTLGLLAKQGYKYTTLKQVRQLLWRLSHNKFKNREEFERYWNNTKMGFALKKMGIKRIRVGKKDRRRKYMVSTVLP